MTRIKRLLSLLLSVLMLCTLLPPRASAAPTLYFTAVNDRMCDLSDETMPFWQNGLLYVAGATVDGPDDLGIRYSYNQEKSVAILYKGQRVLYCDLTAGTMENNRTGEQYAGSPIVRSGMVFFPITALAKTYLHDAMTAARSFKVETKRSDKRFPMTSIELSQYVGGELAEAYPDTVVDVHDPELTVRLEVREQAAYVHAQAVEAAGGMPVGCNGAAVTMLSGGIDSPVSSYMIAKRGVRLIPVHFFSFPYTSELAKEKVISLAKELTAYTGRMTLQIVPFTHIQEEIRRACPEEYFTLIMRRFMMRIAEDIAAHNECKAIVTGENLGQVASQTMEAMACTQAVTHLPVLQPLIGMDKRDIVKIARDIGTFDTSILPYEDCCTVFTPRHPKTRPTVAEVAEAEAALDIDALVREAVDGIERIRIDL